LFPVSGLGPAVLPVVSVLPVNPEHVAHLLSIAGQPKLSRMNRNPGRKLEQLKSLLFLDRNDRTKNQNCHFYEPDPFMNPQEQRNYMIEPMMKSPWTKLSELSSEGSALFDKCELL
jgi:hypothetical protein